MGIDGYRVDVEVNLAAGIPGMSIVGLPDTAVKESGDRVTAAIKNTRLELPQRKITVNLAPADIKKEGSAFDLPIALGILAANGLVRKESLPRYVVVGELSLDGRVKPVKGVLSIADMAQKQGVEGMVLPRANAPEAAVVKGLAVYPVENLPAAMEFINGKLNIEPEKAGTEKEFFRQSDYDLDFIDVKGQSHVKRALEVAASGGHNILILYTIKSRTGQVNEKLNTSNSC